MKKKIVLLAIFICLLISGCGNNSKDQIIAIYDYSSNTETEYDTTNETIDDLVNQICDYLLDGESETAEIPSEALNYKRIDVFENNKLKSDDNRLINIEIYQYGDDLFCKAYFGFSDQEYTTKLSTDISTQMEKLETNRQ